MTVLIRSNADYQRLLMLEKHGADVNSRHFIDGYKWGCAQIKKERTKEVIKNLFFVPKT